MNNTHSCTCHFLSSITIHQYFYHRNKHFHNVFIYSTDSHAWMCFLRLFSESKCTQWPFTFWTLSTFHNHSISNSRKNIYPSPITLVDILTEIYLIDYSSRISTHINQKSIEKYYFYRSNNSKYHFYTGTYNSSAKISFYTEKHKIAAGTTCGYHSYSDTYSLSNKVSFYTKT
jgi:hypothetical protein